MTIETVLEELDLHSPRYVEQARNERTSDAYFAEHGPALLSDQVAPSDATESYVSFEPLGVLLAVMPVELTLLASVPSRSAGAHGGQCAGARARTERVALRFFFVDSSVDRERRLTS